MITTDAVVEYALVAATRAPSVHNTQPWRFVVTPPHLELHLDRGRVLPVADPTGREARISCGAALFNLRAAPRNLLEMRGHPQTVLRVGYGYPAARNPRRAVAAVAEVRS